MPSPEAAGNAIPLTLVQEGQRLMQICNACRYCESFCAVFPAMERRRAFLEADLTYLANLCHDCRECYYSCQYAPPHQFAVNLPKVFAETRRATYRKYSWPLAMAGCFERSGTSLLAAAVLVPAAFTLLLYLATGSRFVATHPDRDGGFYQLMPHSLMIAVFGAAGLFVLAALVAGIVRFWREQLSDASAGRPGFRAATHAVVNSVTLHYLDGGGEGCAYPSELPSQRRRVFHHLTAYGFALCFAATTVAAVYDNVLGWRAPYEFTSAPVILGSLGGVGLLVGPLGLLWLKRVRDREPADRGQSTMDVAFAVLLLLTSVSGFLLLLFREAGAMGMFLGIHLGIVIGLFMTLPYGKFVHGLYRFVALVKYAHEGSVGRALSGPPHESDRVRGTNVPNHSFGPRNFDTGAEDKT